jgi:hypothetical protein
VHPTYKHLEDRIRLGGLTLGQWTQLLACGLAAYALSTLLPLPGSWSLSVAVTVCGLPAAAAVAFMNADFDVVQGVRAAVRWRRGPTLYRAATIGVGERRHAGWDAGVPFDAEALWD